MPRNVYLSSLLLWSISSSACVNHFRKAICSNTVTRKRAIKKAAFRKCAFIVSSVLSGTESDSVLTESIKLDIMSLRRTLFLQNICTHSHGIGYISGCVCVCVCIYCECIILSSTRCTFFRFFPSASSSFSRVSFLKMPFMEKSPNPQFAQ